MRIAVVSDTHDQWLAVEEAIRQEGNVDYLIFLGDMVTDGYQLAESLGIPVSVMIGNCDLYGKGELESMIILDGVRVFACHGHQYDVKEQYDKIFYRGKEVEADLVLFGHTHVAIDMTQENVRIINPGSARTPSMFVAEPSWGLLQISVDLEHNKKNIKYDKKLLPL